MNKQIGIIKEKENNAIVIDCFSYLDKKDNQRKVMLKFKSLNGNEEVLFYNTYRDFEKDFGIILEDFEEFSKNIFGKKVVIKKTIIYSF